MSAKKVIQLIQVMFNYYSVIERSAEVECTHTVQVHAMLTTCKSFEEKTSR